MIGVAFPMWWPECNLAGPPEQVALACRPLSGNWLPAKSHAHLEPIQSLIVALDAGIAR
jgi:hypothetical protein